MAKGERETNASDDFDAFWLTRVYPDPAATLGFEQAKLDSVKDKCLVILDANVLLLPYRLGATSLQEIQRVFADLAKEDRIFLPAQAVREFLKHRADKIRDLVRDLSRQASQIQILSDKKIGFLETNPEYQELMSLSDETKKLKDRTLKLVESISVRLRSGIGSDPVSTAYREIFSSRVTEVPAGDDGELLKEMAWRYRHSIPPGYKDRDKPDEGIGDYLIWKTILRLGQERKTDCILVTEDAKGDWWVQSEGAFQPRLELVDEYRSASGGATLHLLPLSGLLELLNAKSTAVSEAKEAELSQPAPSPLRDRRPLDLRRGADVAQEVDDEMSSMDRHALAERLDLASKENMRLFREKMSIDRKLKDASTFSSLDDEEISELLNRKDRITAESLSNHRLRRRIEEEVRRRFL